MKDDSGQDRAVTPILDTPISVPTETLDALTTINIILDALTVKSQTKVGPGTMVLNALVHSQAPAGGQDVPARVLLLQALAAANVKLALVLRPRR